MTEPMLQIEGLSLWISRKRERLPILEGLSFAVREGERWAVAGESGAGKSMTVHALSALLPRDRVTLEGKILFRDRDGTVTDLLALPYGQRQAFCARRVSLIMQDSMNALNPYMTIGRQWGNVLRLHGKAADPRQPGGTSPHSSPSSASPTPAACWRSIPTRSPAACASGS